MEQLKMTLVCGSWATCIEKETETVSESLLAVITMGAIQVARLGARLAVGGGGEQLPLFIYYK